MNKQLILGIETSCDETASAVYQVGVGIRSSVLFSQIDMQKLYGGVVPELASRTHLEKIQGIVDQGLAQAQVTLADIDVVAITNRPGLPGSLLVGLCFAKSMAWAAGKPVIGIDHLEGHIFSSCIEHAVPFPHLCLTASGGHTAMHIVQDFGKYSMISCTDDDAAGEAFDKIAKLLNLPYPGGPVIERLAREVHFEDFFAYTRGKQALQFSFSGLKTAVMYDLVKRGYYDMQTKKVLVAGNQLEQLQKQVSSSLLVCIKDMFINKITQALLLYPQIQAMTFVGGVACNTYLKEQLSLFAQRKGLSFFSPAKKYCTDNAAMIALVGAYKTQENKFDDYSLDISR